MAEFRKKASHPTLFFGIDLGISQISIVTNKGLKKVIHDLPEAYRQLFKSEEDHYFKKSTKTIKNLSKKEKKISIQSFFDSIFFSLGKPSTLSTSMAILSISGGFTSKSVTFLTEIFESLVTIIDIIPSPLAVAYSLTAPGKCIIVDIGANTVDICRFYGAKPERSDYIMGHKAGNSINRDLKNRLIKNLEGDFVSLDKINYIKEHFGTVITPSKKINLKFTKKNKIQIIDISDNLKKSCQTIVPEIVTYIHSLIDSFHPEFRASLRKNIILTGGSSLLHGLSKKLEFNLKKEKCYNLSFHDSEANNFHVMLTSDPLYAPAIGAFNLARDHCKNYPVSATC